jgi:hypothetical protein
VSGFIHRQDPPGGDSRRGKKRAFLAEEKTMVEEFTVDEFGIHRVAWIEPRSDRVIAARDPEVSG